MEKTNRDSCSNVQKHVLLLQECCWWSTPFICSIQGMNSAENSLDSWTCPRSCNTTYCGQTERVLNCTRGIIKLFSTENNVSLVSENFSTCTVIVWQREKHPHTHLHIHINEHKVLFMFGIAHYHISLAISAVYSTYTIHSIQLSACRNNQVI